MEKLLTIDERIRRAEEIYARRKSQQLRTKTATVNVNDKKNFKLFKKLLLQILTCSMIYYGLFVIQNNTKQSSNENMEKIKQILSYDINFNEIYQKIQQEVMKLQKNNDEVETVQQNEIENQNQTESKEENNQLEEATLSATETISTEEVIDSVELTQMEEDAKQIKDNYILQKPVEGQVSSEFGQRESDNSIVSNNHLGIDIATGEGTKIKAAMEGIVKIAKESSSYRKLH